MPRKKKPPLTFVEEMAKLKVSGLGDAKPPNRRIEGIGLARRKASFDI